MATLRIRVDKKGGTTVKVENVQGPACKDLTKNLERALGNTTNSTEIHPDIDEIATKQDQTQDQGN